MSIASLCAGENGDFAGDVMNLMVRNRNHVSHKFKNRRFGIAGGHRSLNDRSNNAAKPAIVHPTKSIATLLNQGNASDTVIVS